jgi:hypothetical protein
MLICEGPDGAGKTTLAKYLAEQLGMEYRRPPEELLSSTAGPSPGLVDWWFDQLRLPSGKRNAGVYDRCFFISEPIYQMAQVQRELMITGHTLWRGIHDLWSVNARIVFCLPPEAVQYSNVIQDGRASLLGLNNRHLEKISFMYHAFYAMWENALFEHTLIYDYTKHEPQSVVDWVRGYDE